MKNTDRRGFLGGIAATALSASASASEETYELHVWARGSIDETGLYRAKLIHINDEMLPASEVPKRLAELSNGYQIGTTFFPAHTIVLARALPYQGHGAS